MTKAPFDYTGFNETELMQVASVLAVTNPAHCGNTADGLERTMRHIVGHARAEYERSGEFGYLGTLGYVVSTYRYTHGSSDVTTIRFKVTVESWGVLQYINAQNSKPVMSPTLDQTWDKFRSEPTNENAVAYVDTAGKYFLDEMIGVNTYVNTLETASAMLPREVKWSGSPDPSDPDNFWIDDATGERREAP